MPLATERCYVATPKRGAFSPFKKCIDKLVIDAFI
jgi:hypothetical protein